jgi:hypothetical protein
MLSRTAWVNIHLPATNSIIHSLSPLSLLAKVTLPVENSARELTWPRNYAWPLAPTSLSFNTL